MKFKSLLIKTILAKSLLLAFLVVSLPALANKELVSEAANRQPAIVHQAQQKEAEDKLKTLKKKSKKKPNFLIFLVDDMGWGDPGAFGGGEAVGAATPNIDRLAREGLKLTSTYSQPLCTPTRATLLTGRLPVRHGLLRPPQIGETGGLEGEVTIAKLLSDAGYYTALSGKWHLGESPSNQPQYNGFDEYYGFLGSTKNYTEWRDPRINASLSNNESIVATIENSPNFIKTLVKARRNQPHEELYELDIPAVANVDIDLMNNSIDMIKRMKNQDKPWFLYHSFGKVHFDNYPADGFKGSSKAKGVYQDAVVEVDYIVGQVIKALEETGQADNTLVFFTSDNGVETDTWPDSGYSPFRGAKMSTWEGGVRVPGIAWWPGMIEAGRVSDGLFDLADLFVTLANIGQAKVPADRYIDGVDQSSFLLADGGESNRAAVYYYMYEKFSAIRVGPYKQHLYVLEPAASEGIPGYINGSTLHKTAGLYVYNLYLDPKERRPYGIRAALITKQLQGAIRNHKATFKDYPPKILMTLE